MKTVGILFLAASVACAGLPASAKGGKSGKRSYSPARTAPAAVGPRSAAPRRSLLGQPGQPQPSPALAQTIRERESGPGWIGTAFLIALLSGGGLSASDRGWLESRIASMRDNGEDQPEVVELLGAVAPQVRFQFDGLRDRYAAGDAVAVRVRAVRDGKAVPVSCTDPEGREQSGDDLRLSWGPATAGTDLLACRAGGHLERRLVHVEG